MSTDSLSVDTRVRSDERSHAIFRGWLERFESIVQSGELSLLHELFEPDGYWRDILAFTWGYETFCGLEAISAMLKETLPELQVSGVRPSAGGFGPQSVERYGVPVVEGTFDFTTAEGEGRALVQIRDEAVSDHDRRAWVLLTTLQSLSEGVPADPGVTEEVLAGMEPENWLDRRRSEISYADREPEVLIVGAGQGGVILGARLRQIGVDALLIEKRARVGDNWRSRYHALKLHNPVSANQLPYMAFPSTWPRYLPKDMVGDWLELYAQAMELNVWTDTALGQSRYEPDEGRWRVTVARPDATERELHPTHLVLAIGAVSSVPYVPSLPGLDDFEGGVMHSSKFGRGADFTGKNALVVGTGNSGHDIAQAMYLAGAESVTMMQRGSTTVISLEPSISAMYSVYDNDDVDNIDLLVAARPFDLYKLGCQQFTARASQLDSKLIQSLHEVGFRTDDGVEATGFHMKYSTTGGGYYINIGCSDLIAAGKIAVRQAEDMDRFVPTGLRFRDGTLLPLDVVILATGYEGQERDVENLLGKDVADRVGAIWGFNEHGFLRNMWSPTGQDHLWLMGGALTDARAYSRYLALQLKAALRGSGRVRVGRP